MVILETIYLWVYSLIYLAIHAVFPHSVPRRMPGAIRNNEAQKEFSWLEISRKKIPIVNVVIGPYMGWPEIQQVFRFIRQYSIPSILTINGKDDTWNYDSTQYANAFREWLLNLLNRFEVPKEVFVFQILDKECSATQLRYMFLLEACMNIDQEAINPVNRGKVTSETLGNRVDNGQAVDLLLMKKLKNYFFNFEIAPIPEGISLRLKWAVHLFRRIKQLFELKELAPRKKFFPIDSYKTNQPDVLISCLLATKIFEKNLGAVVFKQ